MWNLFRDKMPESYRPIIFAYIAHDHDDVFSAQMEMGMAEDLGMGQVICRQVRMDHCAEQLSQIGHENLKAHGAWCYQADLFRQSPTDLTDATHVYYNGDRPDAIKGDHTKF